LCVGFCPWLAAARSSGHEVHAGLQDDLAGRDDLDRGDGAGDELYRLPRRRRDDLVGALASVLAWLCGSVACWIPRRLAGELVAAEEGNQETMSLIRS